MWVNKKIYRLQRNTGKIINGINQNVTVYTSTLSDGTEVLINYNNIMHQFGSTHYNSISYIKIK